MYFLTRSFYTMLMETSQYKIMREVEDTHFWYVGMRLITTTLLNKLNIKADVHILDAGCGCGANMLFMRRYGNVVGIDISKRAIHYSEQRGLKSVSFGSVNQIPFNDKSFELVTNFDVLGSIEVSEEQALSEFYRVLKPGGYLFLRVSAYPSLYSKHDKVVHTARRYTKTGLIKALEEQSFRIIRCTFANTILFPLIMIRRIWQKRFLKHKISTLRESDVTLLPNWINKLGLVPMLLESWMMHLINFPFGVSLIVIAQKPPQLDKLS